jgi:subtilisin-like proprotein convertase family protein
MLTVQGVGDTITKSAALSLFVESPPTSLSLNNPLDGENGLALQPVFSWASDPNAIDYIIEISENNGFSPYLFRDTIQVNTFSPGLELDTGTEYYWRAKSVNGCGESAWSETRSFKTKYCFTQACTAVPMNISSTGKPLITSTLNITSNDSILDLNVVDLTGTHTWISDLTFTLISPLETEVILMNRICGSNDDFDIKFDDEASSATIPCPPTDGLTYQPSGTLSDFDNELMQGEWTMQVKDNVSQDGGSLNSWSLEICIAEPACSKTVVNSLNHGDGSLRSMIDCACSGDTIIFDPAVFGDTIDLIEPIVIQKKLVFIADPNDEIVISGAGIARAIEVTSALQVVIEGLHVISGNDDEGRGIHSSGPLLLRDFKLYDNPVSPGGGTLINSEGDLNIEGSFNIIRN